MLILIWMRGLLIRRTARLAAAAAGIALAVALPAMLGAFLASAKATMTARSIQRVAVDWQVEQQPGQTVSGPMPGTSRQVSFARIDGFESRQAGHTLTTGAGQVLGLPADYAAIFPGELRLLAGNANGPLLAQQTAANLHAQPGARVTVRRPGLPDAAVTVTGVVELPAADSLFQRVGAPPGAQPQAPPDNVLLLPETDWHRMFDSIPRDRVRTEYHIRIGHQLPPDPAAAYTAVTGQARNLEERMAGTALVGDNLGAALDAAREDALYSQVLFLFLGAPAVVLAALLAGLVTRAGAPRRTAEQALLRTRGASRGTLVRLALAETALVGVAGALSGLGLAALAGRALFGSANVSWWAAALGLLVAAVTVLPPTLHATTVAAARRPVGAARRSPAWLRYGLDLWLLAGSAVIFWITSRNGYQLVLVPEGLPQLSVDYWAFAGPALLWAGAGLLIWRLTRTLPVTWAVRPLAGGLASTVSAMLTRQRAPLARAATLAALAVAFAVSTSVFDTTYRQQAQVDAELTNGADVTVSQTSATARQLAALPGVARVEPLQHRFAYVGSDLQDLYGIRPAATRLHDTYVSGGTAREILDRLTHQPDALLVSQETVNDFQLHLGDQVRLRTEDGTTVPFHYAGVITEFPTAPRDSFLVANAAYLAHRLPTDTTYLITTDGTPPHRVAADLRGRLGPTAKITDVETSRQVVGSSLTAVDLAGLTAIELGYALALAALATGLLLVLGFAERRRTYALARVLGATPRQLGSFVWAEVGLVGVAAAVLGALCGWALSRMLVAVLSGVFDPPPDALAVPWAYLAVLAVLGVAALLAAGAATVRAARRPPLTVLRDL
ncbi:FtsX-like permease family protein [Nonomuraea roseoviolacea]|uniref:ABC transport system permease protein n=1 Tax=Nonomuraea roseoviolacea subsp. carminata TaxID=160689 RepID=A0ABT1KCX2_9ACTN|nr:ABC transporter permease [Nonomuraea roseoviolacea]MCP2351856.1 putative ABC transport system permease protein [Nonomuraea roseoviolacea subsp. carminata]